jgi:S-adenosylmethionine:tRNA ribosyltransferase-isomerase
MRLCDFDYTLPEELIAQYPPKEHGSSRLLGLLPGQSDPQDLMFDHLPDLLKPEDLLVFNDTRVMRARIFGRKQTSGQIEVLIERVIEPRKALALIRANKAPKTGSILLLGEDDRQVEVVGRDGQFFVLQALTQDFQTLMEQQGHMPLPPYIDRQDEEQDDIRYQTVYAKKTGAVAAPTAGLHFTREMLERLHNIGIDQACLTLHVGAGTFQPVRVDHLDQHVMHSEFVEVDEQLCEQVAQTRQRKGRVVAVGTTTVRSLEAASQNGELAPFRGDTQLFIRPGYPFQCVDAMITNFHLPQSTLLMLVAAFAGYERVMRAYRHAVLKGYRFFSYGDAMFLTPK